MELSLDEVAENTVLRNNSHLTNLLKVLFNSFGRSYYDKFLKEIIGKIDAKGI
jgi:hypothetical protein